jgi:hypothetical protein
MKILIGCVIAVALISCGENDDDAESTENFTLSGSGSSGTGLLASTPTVAKITVYQFAVSASADCSSPISVFNEAAGKEVNMEDGPTIGSGELADGSYPCVILEMDDQITFTPATTDGSCQEGVEQAINVCRQFNPESTITSTLIDGTTVTCTDNKEKVAVYISTNSVSSNQNMDPFNAPASASSTSGITLENALEVAGTTSGTFKMDTTNKVDGSNSECDLQPPVFSFASGS